MQTINPSAAALLIIPFLLILYFIPVLIAVTRGKAHGMFGLVMTNLFVGWTVLGWFAALIWASSGITKHEQDIERLRHEALLKAIGGKS